jgi:LAO/AO transport system kinase
VHSMVDCFLLLLLSGAGDELQGIKRGIMEMADIIAINKAFINSELKPQAKQAMQELRNALHYFPEKDNSWLTKVCATDSLEGEGVQKMVETLDSFFNHQRLKGYDLERRKKQDLFWFHETIRSRLLSKFYQNDEKQKEIAQMVAAIEAGRISSFKAADALFEKE